MSEETADQPGATAHLNQVRTLLEANRPEEALAPVQELVRTSPDDVTARCYLAQVLQELGRNDEAIQAAEAALRLDPEREWAHRLRSGSLLRIGANDEALGAALETVRLNPQEPVNWLCLADCQLVMRRIKGARESAERARDLDPKGTTAHLFLGRVAEKELQLPDAATHYRDALRQNPRCPLSICSLGGTLSHLGSHEEALQVLYRGVRLLPNERLVREQLILAIDRYISPVDAGSRAVSIGLGLFLPFMRSTRVITDDRVRARRFATLAPELQEIYRAERNP